MRVFLFHTVELSQMSIYLLIGILTHRAGIVDHKICLILFFLFHISDLLQNSGQFLRISCVHLTAKGRDMKGQRTSHGFRLCFNKTACFFHKIVLAHRLL